MRSQKDNNLSFVKKFIEKHFEGGKINQIKLLIYRDYTFFLYPGVYEPSDESFFLA